LRPEGSQLKRVLDQCVEILRAKGALRMAVALWIADKQSPKQLLQTVLSLRLHREAVVQIQVQFEDVDTRFAENAPLASLGVFCDDLADLVCGDATGFRYASHLKFRAGRRDVGVESRT